MDDLEEILDFIKGNWLIISLILLVVCISMNRCHIKEGKIASEYLKNHPILGFKDSLNGVVYKHKGFKKGATSSVELENKKKHTITRCIGTIDGEKKYLYSFLRKGDSLAKKANSDTIYVYKKYYYIDEYYFVLD